ncbi:MAG: hypothetical protein P8Z77_00250, partial [Candidatus Thiodiazotropha sp.]
TPPLGVKGEKLVISVLTVSCCAVVLAIAEIETLLDEPPVSLDEVPPDPVPPQAVNNNVVDSILTKSTPIKLKRLINRYPAKKFPVSYTEGVM